MSALAINLLGFPAVNRDLSVQLRDPLTSNVVATVQPYSDGTAQLPQVAPGAYELYVNHPNLALPILRRPIRILPIGTTTVSLVIDPSQFKDTPIVDQPVANITPVQQTVDSVSQTLLAVSQKAPGDAIKADDWNAMVEGIRHLADAVSQLTRLVSPQGHNHPELETKIDEMQNNFTTLVNDLSPALVEIQRQINVLNLQQQYADFFDKVQLNTQDIINAKQQANTLITQLKGAITQNPATYGRTVRDVGTQFQTITNTVQNAVPAANTAAHDAAASLSQVTDLMKTTNFNTYDAELAHNRRFDRLGASSGLVGVLSSKVGQI